MASPLTNACSLVADVVGCVHQLVHEDQALQR